MVIPLRFELLCSTIIPISIKVSLDLVKSLYAKFIYWDNQMIDPERSTPSHVTNTTINKDLGQVDHIFWLITLELLLRVECSLEDAVLEAFSMEMRVGTHVKNAGPHKDVLVLLFLVRKLFEWIVKVQFVLWERNKSFPMRVWGGGTLACCECSLLHPSSLMHTGIVLSSPYPCPYYLSHPS